MKTVLVGATGGIAVYKTCEIVRLLQKAGLRVKVVMTENATKFVGPITFRALTHEPVAVGTFDDAPSDPIHHVSLAKEADVFLIAPCTANVIGKIAQGIADDLLTTTAMATPAPLVIAPAMNVNMFESPACQENMALLKERGVVFVEPESGYLACGDEGKGRLADPETIVEAVLEILKPKYDMIGKKVLITTGPTVEPIDAVRFISNPSSGKTGFELARAASERGADVTLVSGPVSLEDIDGVNTVRVRTALEMFDAVAGVFDKCDIAIFSAAVSDYRPASFVDRKLKKGIDDDELTTIKLVENPDILASMGARKRDGQVVVGFAAETDDVVENAKKKLLVKNADMIVANDVSNGKAFGAGENEVVFVTADGVIDMPLMAKSTLADAVIDAVLAL